MQSPVKSATKFKLMLNMYFRLSSESDNRTQKANCTNGNKWKFVSKQTSRQVEDK